MKQLLFIITSTSILLSYSCGSNTQEKTTTENANTDSVATITTQVTAENASQNPTNEFKDVINLLKKDGIKYQIIKLNKEIKISVNATVNSKFSDWTPAKIYAYLSGDNFEMVSTTINNNSNGDFHYETKNIKFNVSNQTMTGGTYFIINKL